MTKTEKIFAEDSYARSCEARIIHARPGAIQLDRTVFYAKGGGQPGDCGSLKLADGTDISVEDTINDRETDTILHLIADDTSLPDVGMQVTAKIDWERRHRHMRMHTCLHLLCAVIEAPVTG